MAIDEEPKGPVIDLDLVIIGAGISGINTSYRLQTLMPQLRFAVLEERDNIGGTWDLFRYPGIRSDSDLQTFGFAWEPWPHQSFIAEGPLIVSYMKDCVAKYGLDRYLNFRHRVTSADWSSKTRKWSITVDNEGRTKRYSTSFLVLGAGYYDYKQPLKTEIPGLEQFKGKIIHPQFWPEEYDYTNKRMVIIGSGATAITLLPNLAKRAAHVTMLQRSPSYIVTSSNKWPGPAGIRKFLPKAFVSWLERCWFLLVPSFFLFLCNHFPQTIRALIKKQALEKLPPHVPFEPHFKPVYNPWEQRVCLAPDGDFYEALHNPNAEVVTDRIKTVSEHSIELHQGRKLETDVIVTATGLRMRFGGEIPLRVNGELIEPAKKLLWNGAMVQDVPNLFFVIGYTNASWTLGADDTAYIITRVIRNMKRNAVSVAVPRTPRDFRTSNISAWDLTATYVKAAEIRMPKYGTKGPWRPRNNVLLDFAHARWGNITGGLQYDV